MTEVSDEMVEAACAVYAKETGYYVELHRGLRSESSDRIRTAMRAALTAALAVAPKPRVRKLEWEEGWSGYDEDIPVWRGNNPLGVHVGVDFAGKYKLEKHSDAPADELIERKAAAQAGYEARILAALEDGQ